MLRTSSPFVLLTLAVGLYTDCDQPAEVWEYVRYLDQEIGNVSMLPRRAREDLYSLYQPLASGRAARNRSALNCLSGAVALMLRSLPLIDRDQGDKAAGEVYLEARKLISGHLREQGRPAQWKIDFADYAAVPKLLGLEHLGDATSCVIPGSPRIFVYDTGKYSAPVLECSAGMEGVEVLLHRFLLESKCRTLDASEADFFYVPVYFTCYQNLHIPAGSESSELDLHMLSLLRSLDFFDVHRRSRHIFLFPHEFWDFPSWEAHIARSVIWAVEANPIVANLTHCTECFDTVKDLVVPGHTDLWAVLRLSERNLPTERRRYLFCYHGSFEHELYERTVAGPPFETSNAAETRRQIRNLVTQPGASIGGHITPVVEYYKRMGECSFCFVPKGVGFTNGRLFESFWSGCIPVILSDAMVVPFQNFVNWSEFSIKMPMGDVAAVVAKLRTIPTDRIKRMKDSLEANACWFNFYSADPSCSPYEGVMRSIRTSATRGQARRHPLFWPP